MKHIVHFEEYEYRVEFMDMIRIEIIKTCLFIKRQWRRFRIIFIENNLVYIFVLFAWVIFLVLSLFWGRVYKDQYTISDAFWDLMNTVFSSVILAVVINGYSKAKEHKDKLMLQYYIYNNVLFEFSSLLDCYIDRFRYEYIPFYNEKCLKQTIEYIKGIYTLPNGSINLDRIPNERWNIILEYLNKVEECISRNEIDSLNNKRNALLAVDRAKSSVINIKGEVNVYFRSFDLMLDSLLDIIEEIRYPWRRDSVAKLKVLVIAAQYSENRIAAQYYNAMHLYGSQILQRELEERKYKLY